MRIICLLGKRGSGKDLIKANLEKLGYNRIISYTTRKPRDWEVNNVDYHFVSEKDFFKLVDKKIIMEWVEHNGNKYGSPHPIGSINNVVEVEPKGYELIKGIYGKQAVGVYINADLSLTDRVRLAKENRGKLGSSGIVVDINEVRDLDEYKFKGIEDKVDLVFCSSLDIDMITAAILKHVSNTNGI